MSVTCRAYRYYKINEPKLLRGFEVVGSDGKLQVPAEIKFSPHGGGCLKMNIFVKDFYPLKSIMRCNPKDQIRIETPRCYTCHVEPVFHEEDIKDLMFQVLDRINSPVFTEYVKVLRRKIQETEDTETLLILNREIIHVLDSQK